MLTPLLRQTWTMSGVLINMFGVGMMLGYPASLLPALSHPDSDIKPDLQASSWLGSILGVAGIPGFLISAILMALFGRRTNHALAILPAIFGWCLIYFAKDIPMLMVGRFFCGITATLTVSLGAVVIGEYTCPKYRGVFLYLKNATVCLGAMVIHSIAPYLHWRTIALVSLTPLCIALFIIYTWPESPAWLVSKCQYEKSQESFFWLMGDNATSRKEIEETIAAQKIKLVKSKTKSNITKNMLHIFRQFSRKDFLKPTFIMILSVAVLEMSGRHIFPAYALQIMADVTGETSQSFYFTLSIDVIIIASAIIGSVLVKVMNRRTLLFYSGFAAIVVLMIFCVYTLLVFKGILPDDKPWISASLLLLYFVLANVGCAPIPLALIGEVFPLAHRGLGSSLSGLILSLFLLAGLKSAPHLLVSVRVHGFFAVYGSIMGICLLILYFILPETKDRTLQEIENYFNYGKLYIDNPDDEEANTKLRKL